MAPVERGDEEVERVIGLMDDLARPLFVLRAAVGFLATCRTHDLTAHISQRRGAAARRDNAAAAIDRIVRAYVAGGEDDKPRDDA